MPRLCRRHLPAFPYARTNVKAVWSLVLGISGFVFVLAAIPALILGYKAKREIRSSGQHGYDLATAGIVLGWAEVALAVAFLSWSIFHG
jgi:hypothetical protein